MRCTVVEVKAVVKVTGALGDGPGHQEHGHADGAASRGNGHEDAPDEHQTGEDLNEGRHRGGGHETNGRMEDLNQLNRLEGGDDGRAVLPQKTEVGALSAGREELQCQDESVAPAR